MITQQNTPPRRFKRLAWANIVVQLTFPVAGVFTPVMAAEKSRAALGDEQVLRQPVVPYTLAAGESVNSVAKRYHLTVTQLKKLNQFRTFSKPFTALKAGDELDVPKPQAAVGAVSPFAVDRGDDGARQVARAASHAGALLGASDTVAAASGQVRGMATAALNDELNQWLQRYGTARVQANIDNHGNLEGSQLDILLPLYDDPSDMVFTQYGLRRIDKRTTANLGVGYRHFFDDWMLGYNTFVDHDITRTHTRMGAGLEFARDYLKLAANGYVRLSGWRDSPDLEDYRERPANGFDIRSEAYLPSLPQLGGKLVYEQYFGDEVGLFGSDHRQKDPHAITAGVNYTPVPLLTLGVDRRQGSSGNGETLFNLGVNYEIGTPWAKQVNPDSVASRRTLAGSRYDLVERNNQIVLEYQKQEVIRLSVAGPITGKAGQTRPLTVSVTSKYGLAGIEWQAPELLAAGGRVLDDGNGHYSLVLPQVAPGEQQTFQLAGVARDTRGNLSHRVTTEVVVAGSAVSQGNSTFTAASGKLAPDGKSKTTLTLTLKDKDGKPLSGMAGSIAFDKNTLPGAGTDPTVGGIREVSPGVYELDVTAGTKVGTLTVTPIVEGVRLTPVDVVFSAALVPAVTNLKIAGRLEIGGVLKGTYTFNPGEGEASDRSLYYWGEKGATAGQVATAGKTVGTSGQAGDYTLTANDAGKGIELAVEAKNGQGTTGNVVTLATDADAASGNATTGGNGAGSVTGALAKPVLSPGEDKLKAKNTGSLNLTVSVTDVLGQLAVNQPVTISVVSAANRQNKAETPTLRINGQASWSGVSDGNGKVTVTLTDPQGLGLKTLLNITTGTGAAQTTAQTSAIFTVLTSPDVPEANYYGHMSNTITVNGVTFKRPPLRAEFVGDTNNPYQTVAGELWSGVYYSSAVSYCGGEAKMPTQAQLVALRSSVGGNVTTVHGWPGKGAYYWSTTKSGENHVDVDLDSPATNVEPDNFGNSISCLQ